MNGHLTLQAYHQLLKVAFVDALAYQAYLQFEQILLYVAYFIFFLKAFLAVRAQIIR